MRIAGLALGLALAAGACASSGTAAADQSATASSTARRTNVITSQELRESRQATVADLIRQTRPSWPVTSSIVYVNTDPDPTGLNRSPANVSEIRYLSKSEAQSKWGSRVQGSVIQIMTR
jgi:hypothetical protein